MKIVIVGSSTGIGRAIAEDLLALGHEVWGVARRAQLELREKYATKFLATQADASNWLHVKTLQEEIKKTWNSIDALILCAGFQGAIGPLSNSDPEDWSQTVTRNLNATFFPLRAFHQLLVRTATANPTKIICFSGGGATQPRTCFSAYATAKVGIVRLVETLAEEWKQDFIELNAIAPGRMNTAMMDEIINKGAAFAGVQEYHAALQQKEKGTDTMPTVLALVQWMLSSKSNGITGKLISAQWDNWEGWSEHLKELQTTDLYTLRRITGKDRSMTWGDKI